MVILPKAVSLFKNRRFKLSLHAENEREKDSVLLKEIEECFFNGSIELIEDYPEDQRGHSFLLLGFTNARKPIHFVSSIHEEELVIITLYRPDPKRWEDWKVRIK